MRFEIPTRAELEEAELQRRREAAIKNEFGDEITVWTDDWALLEHLLSYPGDPVN